MESLTGPVRFDFVRIFALDQAENNFPFFKNQLTGASAKTG
jgi:hypothetical protein